MVAGALLERLQRTLEDQPSPWPISSYLAEKEAKAISDRSTTLVRLRE
jgi:hypothetical protein